MFDPITLYIVFGPHFSDHFHDW